MQFFSFVASITVAVAAAQEALLVQSRLRGSKPTAVMLKAANDTITGEHSGAVEESSCSSEGITPGVCALASLARSAASKSTSPRDQVDEHDGPDVGLLVHTGAKYKLESALLAEIESALAGNHTGFDASELRRLEQELLPIFASLPHKQGSKSGIGYPAARYLLHQHFVRQHSWYVHGLNSVDDRLIDPPVPPGSSLLRNHMAGHLLKVMEDKVGQQGFGLNMLAIFVATLKHLLHGDQQESLKQVWSLYSLQPEDVADDRQVIDLLEVFIAHHIYTIDGYNFNGQDKGFVPSMEVGTNEVNELRETYSGWPKLQAFMNKELDEWIKGNGNQFKFQDTSLIADRLLEYFRKVSGSMCHDMEQSMRNLRGGEKGHVKLADLRTLQTNGENVVDESLDKLHQLGVLDGSTEDDAYVFVPNYILSSSNCDMTTSFYDLCCPNSCEMHKEHLERELLSAKPGRSSAIAIITESVQQRLGSALPQDMIGTLDIIATAHEDAIPIHSRAFADWLREVFPRDCPRTRERDFRGKMGDLLPDANPEFSISV